MSYEALFNPIKIRGLELKNRVVLPGMNTKMVRNKHEIGEDMIAYHVAKAKAGCALNIFEVAAVCPEPHAYMYMGLFPFAQAHRRGPRCRRTHGHTALARRFHPPVLL